MDFDIEKVKEFYEIALENNVKSYYRMDMKSAEIVVIVFENKKALYSSDNGLTWHENIQDLGISSVYRLSDIIRQIILSHGYRSLRDFCVRNDLNTNAYGETFLKDILTPYYIDTISEKLGEDLSLFKDLI